MCINVPYLNIKVNITQKMHIIHFNLSLSISQYFQSATCIRAIAHKGLDEYASVMCDILSKVAECCLKKRRHGIVNQS